MAQFGRPVATIYPSIDGILNAAHWTGNHASSEVMLELIGDGSRVGSIRFQLQELFTPAFSDVVAGLYVARFQIVVQDGSTV